MNSWNHPKWGDGNGNYQQQQHLLLPQLQQSTTTLVAAQTLRQSLASIQTQLSLQSQQQQQQQLQQQDQQHSTGRSVQLALQIPIHSYSYHYSNGSGAEYLGTSHVYHDELSQLSQLQLSSNISPQTQFTAYSPLLQQQSSHLDQDQYNIWQQQQLQQHAHGAGSLVRHQLNSFGYPSSSDVKLESEDSMMGGKLNHSGSISSSSSGSISSLDKKRSRYLQSKDGLGSGAGGIGRTKVVTKRSRLGCLTCRQRKKRCCETKPRCTECCRLGLSCVWPKPGTEHKNKQKDAKLEENTIDHELYGKIKVLRGIVEYRSK